VSFATRTLEFDKVRAMLAAQTSFSAGRGLAEALEPTADFEQAERWQETTAEARRLASQKPDLTLGGARDVRPYLARAALDGVLQPTELLEIADLARCVGRWRPTLLRLAEQFPRLAEIAQRLGEHRPLGDEITRCIAENGELLDAASPELRRLRAALRAAQERVRQRLQEIIASPATRPALQEPILTERAGRYVVPVKAEFRAKIRGIVHDQSASGATLFVEPLDVVELTNRWRQLAVEEQQEIERILRALSRQVAGQASELERSVEALAELDLQQARARLADQMAASRPGLQSFDRRRPGEPVLRLAEARHPLLGPGAVPLSLELGSAFDLLVITGPNTGGKTVALKTVGLLALMAQAGLHLPAADGCLVTVFRSVHADIGDEQSIEQSLSTFSSHVSHIVAMLREIDERGLALLDELGAGTDPQEGSALARAVLEHLRQRRVTCVATTHYSDLKLYAHAAPRVENASVEFDPVTLSPTYRLLVGQPGRSNALAIAARLGMPRVIVDRARAALDPSDVEADRLLDQLQRDRQAAATTLAEVDRERARAAAARTRLEQQEAGLAEARRQAWQEAEAASKELLAELRREVDQLRREARRRQADLPSVERLVERARALQPVAAPPEPRPERPPPLRAEPAPAAVGRPPAVGDEILVPSLGVAGRLSRLEGDEAELDVRGMRVRLARSSLADAQPVRGGTAPTEAPALRLEAPAREVALQLDLRGQRRDEAAEALDRYLNDAYLAGLRSVRIVHGKGTGAVRQAVHAVLDQHPLVRKFSTAAREAGGEGATEIDLVA
jgi:DNA mismatch repair protein MutS2